MIKKLLLKIINLLGYEISKINKEGTHFNRIIKLVDLIGIDLVIDVGANKGQFAQKIRQIGYKQKIISFEPLKEVYSELISNSLNDNNWEIYPMVAVGDSNSKIRINVSENLASSSVLEIQNEHIIAEKSSRYIKSYKVDQVRLDDLNFKTGFSSIFLKIDVQGYEFNVLRGAEDLLKKIALLKIEISFTKLYQETYDWKKLINFLESKGFEIWDFENGFRNKNNLKLLQADVIFVNNKFLR